MDKRHGAFYALIACFVLVATSVALSTGHLTAAAEQKTEPPHYLDTPTNVIATEASPSAQPKDSKAPQFKVTVSDEAAERLRRAIAASDAPDDTAQTEAATSGGNPEFNYDTEIQKAKDRGDSNAASYLETCRDTPAGGVLLTPASMEETILALCKVRDFEVKVSTSVWQPTIAASSSSHGGKSSAQGKSPISACRAEAEQHITKCVPQLGNCTLTGCEYNYVCDAGRLSRCASTNSINNGPYYCDTRNRKHSAYDRDEVIAMACDGK